MVVTGGIKVAISSFKSILVLKFDISILMSLAIVGAVVLEEWFEAGTVVTVFVGSEVLKS